MIFHRVAALAMGPLCWRIAAVLVAAMLVVAQWSAAPLPRSSEAPAAQAARGPAPKSAAVAASAYPAIAEHPLFSPTRQPWIPLKTPSPTTAHVSLENYKLTGIILGDGQRVAVLRTANGGKTVILSEGQILEGWTLREIGGDILHFERDGDIYDLTFTSPRWRRG
jgi:type II secretory pathway component PulC